MVRPLLAVIQGLASDGMIMMVVTHELAFARECANELVFMDDGLIVARGSPAQLLGAPRHERTRAFLSMVL